MSASVHLYDVVALTADIPAQGLLRGQVGTVVLQHEPDVFEVEFSDNDGHAYAILPLSDSQLMVLHHQPISA